MITRRNRLARLIVGAGESDMSYGAEVIDIGNKILSQLTWGTMRVNTWNARIYDVSKAFPEGEVIYLAFAPPESIPGYNAAVATVNNNIALVIAVPGRFWLVDDRDLVEFIKQPDTWTSFIHEVSHLVRSHVQKVTQQSNPPREEPYDDWIKKYLRSPPEIDAHFMQFLVPLIDRYQNATGGNIKVLQGDIGRSGPSDSNRAYARLSIFGRSARDLWAKFVQAYPEKIERAPSDVRNRWIRRFTQFYNHLLELEKNAA